MPIRRINWTGRKRIAREDARVFVRPDSDGTLLFTATLDLSSYDLPADAKVFVEAYCLTTFMRFEHGTASAPRPPEDMSRRLTEFTSTDGLLFRVKVTSTDGRPGVLLAEADRIPVVGDEEQPDRRIPLLPPIPRDLDQELWRLEFDDVVGPRLLVNNRFGEWRTVAASPPFRSLVFPAVMRQVLWQMFFVEGGWDPEDPDGWQARWLQFSASLPGVGQHPSLDGDRDALLDWVETAVEAFARQHSMLAHYRAFSGEGKS